MIRTLIVEPADEYGFFIDRKAWLEGLIIGTVTRHTRLFMDHPFYTATSPHGVESPAYTDMRHALGWLINPLVDGDPYDIIDAQDFPPHPGTGNTGA